MPYKPRKAAQTIAFFIMKNGGAKMHVLKAVKLVFLADRKSLEIRGHAIQDEHRVSMDYGPVNSVTLNCLNGFVKEARDEWQVFLSARAGNHVGLPEGGVQKDDLDELSTREIGILEEVWEKFGDFDRFDLADWTHKPENIPEWEDPDGSSIAIPLERMMSAVGLDHPIERARESKSLKRAQNILASL